MADAVLSVEIRAKMSELSKGLKIAEDGIDNFVLRGSDSIKLIEEQFKFLGKTSKEIAANMNAAFKNVSFKEVALGANVSKAALDELKVSAAQNRTESSALVKEQQKLKLGMEGTKKAILEVDLAFKQGKVSEQEYKTETARLNTEMKRFRLEQAQGKASVISLAGSYDEMRKRITALGREIRAAGGSMDGSNAKVKGMVVEYNNLNEALKRFDASMGNHQRNVGHYGSALNGIKGQLMGMASMYLSIHSAIAAGKSFVNLNRDIDASIVDVQRSTQMTRVEIETLKSSLMGLRTSTSLEDLLGISFIGGKLGVATEELLGFTKAADQLQIALGKEIGGDIEHTVEELGKIVSIYSKDGKITGDALQHVANSIITLAHAGVASAPYIVDFTKRLGGIEKIADIGLGASIGLGAALEELGVSAEVGGTAVTQIMLKMGQNVPKYAALAGKGVEEFSKTLNTNAMEALIQMAEGLQKNKNGFVEIAASFKEAEAKGVRVAATLGVIGGNASLMREKIDASNGSLHDSSVVAQSTNLRMNSLGAVMDQVGNKLKNNFISSGFSESLRDIIGRLGGVRTELDSVTEAILAGKEAFSAQQEKLTPLLKRYDELKAQASTNSIEQEELRGIIAAIGSIMPSVVSELDKYGKALDINRGKVGQLTTAQRELLQLREKGAIKSLNSIFDQGNNDAESFSKKGNDLQDPNNKATIYYHEYLKKGTQALQGFGKVFKSLPGADLIENLGPKEGDIKGIEEYGEASKKAMGDAYDAAVKLRDVYKVDLTEAQQSVIDSFEKDEISIDTMRSWEAEHDLIVKVTKAHEVLGVKLKQIGSDKSLPFGKKSEQEMLAYQQAIKSLVDSGVSPLDASIQKLEASMANVKLGEQGADAKNVKVEIDKIGKAYETLSIKLKQISADHTITFGKNFEQEVSAYKQAINNLIAAGIDPLDQRIKDLQSSIENESVWANLGKVKANFEGIGDSKHGIENITDAIRNLKAELAELGGGSDSASDKMITDIEKMRMGAVAFATDLQNRISAAKGSVGGLSLSFKNMANDVNDSLDSIDITNVLHAIPAALGDVMAGVDNAFNAVLIPIADLAIRVGKIAIGTGVAIEGIKKALASLNPFAAIAAGVALIALGSWAKSSLSNAGSGKGSSSSSSESKGTMRTIPKFANGGIVSGPTLGLMGEYAGASTNPEVIAPLDKLTAMIRQAVAVPNIPAISSSMGLSANAAMAASSARSLSAGNSIRVEVTGEFRQRGSDLVATVEQAQKKNNNFF